MPPTPRSAPGASLAAVDLYRAVLAGDRRAQLLAMGPGDPSALRRPRWVGLTIDRLVVVVWTIVVMAAFAEPMVVLTLAVAHLVIVFIWVRWRAGITYTKSGGTP